jgi:hypothetical protein
MQYNINVRRIPENGSFMNEIRFIDRSFDQTAAGNYSLSIQVNYRGLAYCIADEGAKNFIYFRKLRFTQVVLISDLIKEIGKILETDEILKLPYHHVRFMGYTQQSTLVPESYYSNASLSEYLKFNFSGDTDNVLFNNLISAAGLHNVFALPEELVTIITSHFKKVEFMNQTTPFIRHIANLPGSFGKPGVFIGLNPDFFDIACVADGGLKLYNTFQYTSENDLLYYTIYVFEKMGFDTLKTPLMVSGEFCSKQNYFEVLKQYLPETGFDVVNGVPILAPGLQQVNTSRFLNLFNLQMCGS